MFGVQELYCNQFSYYKYDWLFSSHHQKTRLKLPLSCMYWYSLLEWLWFRVEHTHELTSITPNVTVHVVHVKKNAWEPPRGSSKAFPMEGFSLPPPLTQQRFDMVGRPLPPKKTQHPAALHKQREQEQEPHESFGAVSWIKMKPFDVRCVLKEWYCWMVQKSGFH